MKNPTRAEWDMLNTVVRKAELATKRGQEAQIKAGICLDELRELCDAPAGASLTLRAGMPLWCDKDGRPYEQDTAAKPPVAVTDAANGQKKQARV